MITGGITIEVMDIRHGKVRLGFTAPDDVVIDREEIAIAKESEARQDARSQDAPPPVRRDVRRGNGEGTGR